MKPTRRLLRLPAVIEKVGGGCQEFIEALIANDGFPKPKPLSRRVQLWDETLVDEWIAGNKKDSQAA